MEADTNPPDYVPQEGTRLRFRFDVDRASVQDSKEHQGTFRRFVVGDQGHYYLIADLDRRLLTWPRGPGNRLVAFRVTGSSGPGRLRAILLALRRGIRSPPELLDERGLRWLGPVDVELDVH